jgi:hypothetical protein
MATRKRVYVAGAYSAPTVIEVMANMRRGLALSAEAVAAGFAVYSPWCDCLLHFLHRFELEECYAYSMPWLEVADAVLVVPEGAYQSRGTTAELARAGELQIPVFFEIRNLIAHFRELEEIG